MTRNWMLEARRDVYRRRARSEGYRSRAAYKLLEADKKFRLIKDGAVVVELGAWPGGMSQVASRMVGPRGLVVAVDIKRFKKFEESNIIPVEADICEEDVVSKIIEVLNGRQVDLLISDASPKFTGVREVDVIKQMELTEKAYRIALEIVKKEGSIMLKAFECDELKLLEEEVKRSFKIVKRFIPSATRKTSSELYLIAQGKI
ncbi:MAG: RlmE family RNA methyltransferase [Aigarchaeota archaeon]|nr:RlmE family RNA methyltransferase [Aigarchaeota archaeon]MCX8193381.1 RlmE family RNA methyltransferase [Nitrososphaeria archaeon]MDW7985911.1 RlmE family RNA methyltransferase [Nitrososphaerota archaeon]